MVSDVSISTVLDQQASSTASATQLAEDFSQFLTLLTTQLQYQDPMDPMDTAEMTNQLVAFTGVEQQINTNQKLDSLVALNLGMSSSVALDYVGKNISYISSEFGYDGVTDSTIRYSLGSQSEETTIRVLNEDGQEIYTTLGNTSAGAHDFVWDGSLNGGGYAPSGTYEIVIDALDSDGEAVDTQTVVKGLVKGTEVQNGSTYLIVGERAVALGNVLNAETTTANQNVSDAMTLALQYIGMDVNYNDDSFAYTGGDVTLNYALAENADRARIVIKNDQGKTIYSEDAETSQGSHSFTWDGHTYGGAQATPSEYYFSVEAVKQNTVQVRDKEVTYDGETDIETSYTLTTDADSVMAYVKEPSGSIIYTKALSTTSGNHSFKWHGEHDMLGAANAGDYEIEIVAMDDEDTDVATSSLASGKVTGVEASAGHILLTIDNIKSVPLENITNVSLPTTSEDT